MRKSLGDKLKREVKYTNKDFGELRNSLINYAKNYFPDTYKDFNEASPGMMFIEMAAYIGDVLNFYADVQLQESFLYTVNEQMNLYNLSQGMGYKPKTLIPAQVDLDVMQLVPAIGDGENTEPDFRYAVEIKSNMQVSTEDNVVFRTIDSVNFRYSSSYDPTDVSIYQLNTDGSVGFYLLRKQVRAVQGQLISEDFDFVDAKKYDKIVLQNTSISEIVSVTDSDGDTWYEVPYLAQDLIPVPIRNIEFNSAQFSQYRSSVPYLLCYRQTEKRFVTRRRKDDFTEIQFGSGLSSEADEEIIPNPMNVGLGLDYYRRAEDISVDPANFLYTKTYGSAPNNTTLTVQYAVSNGILGNVKSNTINNIISMQIEDSTDIIESAVLGNIIDSIVVNNNEPAYGGVNKKPLDIIREEAMANFAAQNRAVTREDYILRCYTMHPKYGAIAKAYIEQDTQISRWNQIDRISNQNALNLYILTYNSRNQFQYANPAIKENLRQYLRQYRLLTDAINIKNPYIINIGVNYDIILRPNFNSYEVLLRCNDKIMDLLKNENMEISAPIIMSSIITEIDKIEGVQSVENFEIINLTDDSVGYSPYYYSIKEATRNGILYPSLDPSIFEVRFPKNDIKGRVVDF